MKQQGFIPLRRVLLQYLASWGVPTALAATSTGLRAAPRQITIGAATSIADFVKALAVQFEKINPGLEVRVTAGASDIVASQAIRGAPIDLLILADDLAMSRVVSAGLVQAGTTKTIARNRLVLVTRQKISKLSDLSDKSIRRIAIGNPAVVPAGRYAREAFAIAGVWPEIEGKIVYGNNVRHALEYLLKGEAQAAVIYQSDLLIKGVDKLNVFTLDVLANYPMAVLTRSREPELVTQFAALALSEPARMALRQLRFELP